MTGNESPLHDDELVARVAAGDETALRLLVDRWQRPVFAFFLRCLGNEEDARDLAQECFLKVFRHAGSYEAHGRFRAWLFRIAGNLCRSRLRRRRILRWLPLNEDLSSAGPAAPRSFEADAQQRSDEIRQAIQESVAELPERQRLAFSLRHEGNLSYREIGKVLRASESAVESLLVRATRHLQESLRAKGFGDDF
jgi:RNA polymerase sigma-70 factor (ECF subfamily)